MLKFLLLKSRLRRILLLGACIQMFCVSMAFAQQVSGKVTSVTDGEGIPGVNIVIKGTTSGTVTDVEGNYKISDLPDEATLVFSAIGYATEEVPVNGRSVIDLAMTLDLTELDEIVVIGYGVQKKSDVTGAVAQVTGEQLKAMPVQNALQGLQGRAAGVDISSNVRPGEVGVVRIRGERSMAGTNNPLYVVDGVPLQSGGIESFNPNDIESIEVLKDASASAIYGSRAANGVILVTTKKGKTGRAQINYNAAVTFERINDLSPNFNAAEYAEYRRDAAREAGYGTLYPDPNEDFAFFGGDASAWESIASGYTWASEADKAARIPVMRPTTAEEQALWGVSEVPLYDGSKIPTTNWTDYVEQTGVTQNHNLSVSMGTEKVKAYVSGGYLDQVGTNVGQDYKRYSGMLSLEVKAVDWLTVGGTINSSYAIQNYGYSAGGSRGSRTIYEAAKGQLPFAVPYDAEGNYIFNPGGSVNIINPIRDGNLVTNERTTLRVFGSFFAEAKLTEGLRYRVIFGPDVRNYRNGQFQSELSSLRGGGSLSSTNSARYDQNQQVSWTLENLLYYDKTFNEQHKIGLTLLQSSSLWRQENSAMSASDVPYNSQLWYNLGSTNKGALDGWGSGFEKSTLMSYMARVNYTFADKYLLTLTGRADGASPLAKGNKWDFFPAAALAWKAHEEDFLNGISAINQLKFRVGVGVVGNAAVAPYNTAGGLVRLPYVFGEDPASGYVTGNPKGASSERGSLPNKALGWEKSQQWNFAVDFGIFRDRISGTIDYYITNTTDLLLDKKPNPATGYSLITVNAGNIRNRGIEVLLNTVNIERPDFQWTSSITFSRNRNEIVELAQGKQDDLVNNRFIGEPIGIFYDYKKIGVWQLDDAEEMQKYNDNGATYEAGDIRVEDVNGDYIIDANHDRQIVGNTVPKWTGGILNTFTYKNFELSAFVFSRWGYTVLGGGADMSGQFASRKIDYWTENNPTNDYPRADWGNGGQPIHGSTLNYRDGSYVKVRYISLGYTLPQSLIERAHLSNVKVYAQVLNPFLYSKTDFLDPDSAYQNSGSNNSASGITSRSFVFGLNLSF